VQSQHKADPKKVAHTRRRAINSAIAINDLMGVSSAVLPMNSADWRRGHFPGLSLHLPELDSMENTAIIMAAAIHSISIPYRAPKRGTSMLNLTQEMCPYSRLNLLSLSADLSFPLLDIPALKARVIDEREPRIVVEPIHRAPYMAPFGSILSTPKDYKDLMIAEWAVLRGIDAAAAAGGLRSDPLEEAGLRVLPKTPWEHFDEYCDLLDRSLSCGHRHRTDASAIPLLLPAAVVPQSPDRRSPKSAPASMLTDLHNARSTELYIAQLLRELTEAFIKGKGGMSVSAWQPQAHLAFDQSELAGDAVVQVRQALADLQSEYSTVSER